MTIEPIITVTRLSDCPSPTKVSGSSATTHITGRVVTSPSFQLRPKVTVRITNTSTRQMASVCNCYLMSCALTLVPMAATPVSGETCTGAYSQLLRTSLTPVTAFSIPLISLSGMST